MTATAIGLCVARPHFRDIPAPDFDNPIRPMSSANLGDMASEFVRQLYERGDSKMFWRTIDRNRALELTTQYIQQHLSDVSDMTAQTIAAQAISEVECRRLPMSFDMDKSTSYAVFLRDHRTGYLHVITAQEICRLLALDNGQTS